MDGGGRVLEPLIAGLPGGAVGRATTGSAARGGWNGLAGLLPRRASPRMSVGFGRRRSVAVPMARRLPRFLGTGLTLGFFALVGGYGMVAGGHWELLRAQQGDPRDLAARALGFGLDRVTISGIAGLSEREILGYAGLSPRASLPFLSVAEIRDRLERVPLIRSASVRKLYPGELAITLVERTPFALWQKNGELNVVAADGAVIDTLRDARLAALPLVVGEGANEKAADFLALLDAAGPLRPRIRAGMLVAGRRWTLKMDNGLDVRLPELGAADAVARLVRLEREQRILDKDVLAVDLRIADRVIVRLSEEAASARAEAVKKRIGRGTKGIDT